VPHEVVCFSSDHGASVADLPAQRLATIGRAWAHRTSALSALPEVEQVFVFENRGAQIGATLIHPHGQIYAYPYLPPPSPVPSDRLRSGARHDHSVRRAQGGLDVVDPRRVDLEEPQPGEVRAHGRLGDAQTAARAGHVALLQQRVQRHQQIEVEAFEPHHFSP
jgi:hypothetical protein